MHCNWEKCFTKVNIEEMWTQKVYITRKRHKKSGKKKVRIDFFEKIIQTELEINQKTLKTGKMGKLSKTELGRFIDPQQQR